MPTAITHDPVFTTPVSSTNTAVVRWSGTAGSVLQNSGVLIDGSNNITGIGTIASGAITSSGAIIGTQVDILAAGDLRLQDSTGGQYVALEAAGTTTTHTITLPATQGAASTFLQNNGSGALTWAAAGGAVTRVGGQTTEATTTSTGDTDLLTIGSLTIPGATPIHYIADFRKSSGAATDARGGLKLNSTKIGGRTLWDTDGTNEDQTGVAHGIMGGRVTNYLAGMSGGVQTVYKTDVTRRSSEVAPNSNDSNPSPTADVTSWIVVGSVGSASTTLGIDEVHVYTMGVS